MNKPATLGQYLNWLVTNLGHIIEQARELRRFPYCIVGWSKGNDFNQDRLIIKIVGTATEIPLTPTEIYEDDTLVQGFSPADVKVISTLAMMLKFLPKYHLVLQEFRGKLEDYVVVYGERGITKQIRISVKELAKNTKMLEQFSPMDAFKIGQTYAENQFRAEKKKIAQLSSK